MTLARVVVCDDEPLAREMLTEMLEELGATVLASVSDGGSALVACERERPDVLFLDIEMPKLDGFEVLDLLENRCPVVFVTAFEEYAVRAFEREAIDYVLKPYSLDRLQKALRRAQKAPPRTGPTAELAARLRKPQDYLERIAIKDGSDIFVLGVSALDWARSEDDYVRLASERREILKHQSLKSLEDSLDPKMFVRIHRTCLVNVSRVVRIEPETRDRYWVCLKDGTKLPASRSGEKRLREILGI